jgi:hypothetical protein
MLNILSHPTISYSKLHFVLESAVYYFYVSSSFLITRLVHVLAGRLLGWVPAGILALDSFGPDYTGAVAGSMGRTTPGWGSNGSKQ